MKAAITVLLFLATVPLAACASLGFGDDEPDPKWVERELSAPSENVVWQVALETLTRLEYPLGSGLQPDRLIARSGWRNTLAPFKDQGYRLRATIEISPLASPRFLVRVRVERQVNRALVKPLDLRYAEWDALEDDEGESAIIVQHIRTYLDTEIPIGPR
jgi:hypothetical protein